MAKKARQAKMDAFCAAAKVLKDEGTVIASMAEFVDKYLLHIVPDSKFGNPKLMAEWGRGLLGFINTEFKDAGLGSLDFPDVPDLRIRSAEEIIKAKREKAAAKAEKAKEEGIAFSKVLADKYASVVKEVPVNHAGERASV